MAGVSWLGLLVFGATLQLTIQARYQVDMTGPGCYETEDRIISDDDIYTLYAEYKFNQQPSMDHCDVSIRPLDANRRLRYYVERLVFFDCGISIMIFDDPRNNNLPKQTLTCDDNKKIPIQGITNYGMIKFSLRKQSTQSQAFSFQIQVTTDFGPDIDFEKNASEFYEAPLDTGAIVGIAIAGAILAIALIGLAIYCCLRNRSEHIKNHHEASGAASAPSVFTSGTSQALFSRTNNQRQSGGKGGGGGKYGSMEDVRSTPSSTDKASNVYTNNGYQTSEDEKKFNRQGSHRRAEKGGNYNAAFDDTDTGVREGHVSRRNSGPSAKYDKKKNFSRNEDYEMAKVNPMPVNGILKASSGRSRSPNRSQSSTEDSTIDSNALVHGYSQTTQAHPNVQHIPVLERTRSRSRSRGGGSHRSGSTGRSRSGSVGKSSGKDMKAVKTNRQYNDMSHFLDQPKKNRPRSRSGSAGRRARSDSRNSEHVPSEVSFAPSANSSKKNTGGKRVHIQGTESDI